MGLVPCSNRVVDMNIKKTHHVPIFVTRLVVINRDMCI